MDDVFLCPGSRASVTTIKLAFSDLLMGRHPLSPGRSRTGPSFQPALVVGRQLRPQEFDVFARSAEQIAAGIRGHPAVNQRRKDLAADAGTGRRSVTRLNGSDEKRSSPQSPKRWGTCWGQDSDFSDWRKRARPPIGTGFQPWSVAWFARQSAVGGQWRGRAVIVSGRHWPCGLRALPGAAGAFDFSSTAALSCRYPNLGCIPELNGSGTLVKFTAAGAAAPDYNG